MQRTGVLLASLDVIRGKVKPLACLPPRMFYMVDPQTIERRSRGDIAQGCAEVFLPRDILATISDRWYAFVFKNCFACRPHTLMFVRFLLGERH